MAQLTREQILRYSRHLIMPEVGIEGQQKLRDAGILLIGAGGLGSPLGLYLAAAGIGRLGLVDFDTVDFSNLQRQIIHRTEDVGRLKVESAKERIRSFADSTFNRPTSSVPWMICRWRFVKSTVSKSTIPSRPTPAAAR